MNVISSSVKGPEENPTIDNINKGFSQGVTTEIIKKREAALDILSDEEKESLKRDNLIQKSDYGVAVNKVFQDVSDILLEHGEKILESEVSILVSNKEKYKLILGLNSLGDESKIDGMKLYKAIIRFIIKELPYISRIKINELMRHPNVRYEEILLEMKKQKNKSLEHEKLTANNKSYKEALKLWELLWPIENRLKNVKIFTNGLAEYKDIQISGKEVKADDCNTISINNQDKITKIFKKLRSDKNKISELEKDKVIILKLEKEIVDAAKISFGLYIQHMCSLYRDTFTRKEHDNFRESLIKKVHNSEHLENFRIKLFRKLVQLKIRKIKTPKKNHGVRLQKK